MANSGVNARFKNDPGKDLAARVRLNQQRMIVDARFWRCYRTLHFIAHRVLGGSERAEEAIGSCLRVVSRHPRRFEHEGEFHGWLLRVLIDEALALLHESVPAPAPEVLCEPTPSQAFRTNDGSDGKGDNRTDDQQRVSLEFSMALE